MLVHIRDVGNMPDLIYSEIEFSDNAIEPWSRDSKWTNAILDSEILSCEIGDNWLQPQVVKEEVFPPPLRKRASEDAQSREPVLQVPSSVIREECNYLLDPQNPKFPAITWSEPKRFRIDPRLIDPGLR